MKNENWESRTEKIVNLKLDEQNIRLDLQGKSTSQASLIHDLFVNQDALSILEDISRVGFFPHELPIVVGKVGNAIVLEGNRRIAALKAAINPAIVPAYAKRIESIVSRSTFLPIGNLEVKVAPNRKAASKIIAAIHTRTSKKPWATLRQAYFYFAQVESGSKKISELILEYPEIDIPRFVRMWEMHRVACSIEYSNDEDAAKVSNQQTFPITTLERIYSSEEFRRAFKLTFDDEGQLHVRADEASFKESMKGVILDIVRKKVTSRKLNNSVQISEWLKKKKTPRAAVGRRPLSVSAFKPVPIGPRVRSFGLAPRSMRCDIPYPALGRVLLELQGINYKKYPNASHDLLRSFLECALKAYFTERKINFHREKKYSQLKDLLDVARKHFEADRTGLVQVIDALKGSRGYLQSQDLLNAINHNPNVFSNGEHVRDAWDQMEPLLRRLLSQDEGL